MNKINFLLLVFSAAFVFLSCERSPFAPSMVEFRGQVFYGTLSPDGVDITGVLPRAQVTLIGNTAKVTANENGEYVLRVEVYRRFQTPNYESFTLEASGISPAGKYLRQEITLQGKPGDVFTGVNFLLYGFE